MCRFLLYIGNPIRLASLITEPENSLIHQSYDSKERSEPLNGDGFGVAWYSPEVQTDAALFRSVTPAWNNQNLRHLARAIRSGCVMAHVRAASIGMAVTEPNTHPFVHGAFSFMHNGEIAQFRHVRRNLLDGLEAPFYDLIEGTTDSECLFAYILQILGVQRVATAEVMAAAVEKAIAIFAQMLRKSDFHEPSYVNVAVTNGLEAVACRLSTVAGSEAPSLHYHTGKLYSCRSGKPVLIEADEDDHAIIVSSEPLTEDSSWRIVPNNTFVLIGSDRTLSLRPVRLPNGQ